MGFLRDQWQIQNFEKGVRIIQCAKSGKNLVGTKWAISLLLCMNGLRKRSSSHAKLFSRSVGVIIGKEP